MSGEKHDLEQLGQRVGQLLRASAEQLDGATRSRLAQARAAALDAPARPRSWLTLRYLAPVGVMASAALATLLLVQSGLSPEPVNEAAPAALYDMELLADADALELAEESDLEFIEWAAGMAELEGAGG